MNLAFSISVGLLTAVGVWFVLARSTFRVVVGLLLLGYATNFIVIGSGGFAAAPPLLDTPAAGERADPLPQALVLTAIVITMGMTLYLLAVVVARDSDGTGPVVERLSDPAPGGPARGPVEQGGASDAEEVGV